MNSLRNLAISAAILATTTLWLACSGARGGLESLGDAGNKDATTSGGPCVSGQQVACACIGGGQTGVQTCNADGHSYGTCRGCPANDDSSKGGRDADLSDDMPPASGDAGSAVGDGGGDGGCTPLTAADLCGANGCACPTPGCCGTGCQLAHSNGSGQTFYDCAAHGTHTQAQARVACAVFTGDAGACKVSSVCCDDSFGLCITVPSTDALCGSVSGNCHCWSYAGNDSGTVQSPHAACAEICPAASDPSWN